MSPDTETLALPARWPLDHESALAGWMAGIQRMTLVLVFVSLVISAIISWLWVFFPDPFAILFGRLTIVIHHLSEDWTITAIILVMMFLTQFQSVIRKATARLTR